jgi:hypothetical protein
MRFNGIEIADIFSEYGEEYRNQYHQPANLTKVMNLITCCRTSALGGHIEKCDNCGYETNAYNSCRNRHCPKCQFSAKERWLKAREGELLPVPYYHVVFTIPNELNQVVLINKRVMYNILFRAASETLIKLGKDPKHLGANIGLVAVLHTWGQNLMDHPHLHCIVPGGGLTPDTVRWRYSKKAKYHGFFIHVNIISDLFKKKFLYYFKKAYRNSELRFVGKIERLGSNKAFQKLLNELYEKKWVTYCKRPFGGPKEVLEYLGRYTHRVAISNNRIKTIENGKVVFEWKDYSDNNKKKEMALTPVEFIRRFMLHILPGGFFKIRYYGILSSRNKKAALKKCREILVEVNAEKKSLRVLVEPYKWVCSKCKEGKVFVVVVNIRAAPA